MSNTSRWPYDAQANIFGMRTNAKSCGAPLAGVVGSGMTKPKAGRPKRVGKIRVVYARLPAELVERMEATRTHGESLNAIAWRIIEAGLAAEAAK